jgi:hypothetical protein
MTVIRAYGKLATGGRLFALAAVYMEYLESVITKISCRSSLQEIVLRLGTYTITKYWSYDVEEPLEGDHAIQF